MQKACIALAVVVTIALAGCRSRVPYRGGWGSPSRPSAGAGPAGWFPVRQPNAGFACRMPAAARVESNSGYAEDGASYQSMQVYAEAPFGRFAVFVTQWQGGVVGDPLEIARHLADSILEHTETPDRHANRVSIPGFYAREDTGHAANGTFFAFRQFFGRDRIYVAVASVRDDRMGLRAAEQFMQSISLDRHDALLPYGDSSAPVPIYLPDADFAVDMPPLASRRSAEITVDGETESTWVFESRHPSGVCRVTVVPFRSRVPEGALDSVAEALSLGAPGRYLSASGYPGRAYTPEGDRRARAFETTSRVYVLELTGVGALGDAAADAFFDSFRIL